MKKNFFVRYDRFSRNDFFQNISGKDKLQDLFIDKVKSSLSTSTEQSKKLKFKKNFIETNFNGFI